MGLLNRNSTIVLVSVVGAVTLFIAIFALSLDGLYDHNSHLFEFGPSEQLIFIGITIDTWLKYILLVIFMLTLELLEILQEEYLHPFVHMVYDANTKENQKELSPYSWGDLYFINHLSVASGGLRQIIRVIVVTIQIPLAILVWLLKEAMRIYFIVQITNNWFLKNDREVSTGKRRRRFY